MNETEAHVVIVYEDIILAIVYYIRFVKVCISLYKRLTFSMS